MKFMSILLKEGRKEDLKKKYSTKFNEQDLDFILNISDLVDFNHKYTDFVLKNTDGDGELDTDELEHFVGLIKDFDKYQSQFPKKDINQYVSLNELEKVILYIRSKNKEKELEGVSSSYLSDLVKGYLERKSMNDMDLIYLRFFIGDYRARHPEDPIKGHEELVKYHSGKHD